MFTFIFLAALLTSVLTRLWLAGRQIRHVAGHSGTVPDRFAGVIQPDSHLKAARYTIARTRLSMLEVITGAALIVALTMLGGLQWINGMTLEWLGTGYAQGIALVAAVIVASSLIDLPFALYGQFVIEERFGFNRMTIGLWLADLLKSSLLGIALGVPLLLGVLWIMQTLGEHWWLWAWVAWVAFNLMILVAYPTVIAPLFNKFEPLQDETLKSRIETLMQRCGFASKGLFVMDGSRRSAHGNAYFTGLGAAKRIVFFDTLLARLNPDEVEAVLAHELGHFKHRHVLKRIVLTFALSLGFLWLLGWLATQTWFYTGLGVMPDLAGSNDALALILFFIALPVFTFFFKPLASISSRRHEFEADEFAARQSNAGSLISALVKLYQDNGATLTPDPLYSAFYASHPPAAQRIGRLERSLPAAGA